MLPRWPFGARVPDSWCRGLLSPTIGKSLATYPANLCPLHCGGAASHSGPRTTILHSEGGHCKRFL
jgi:hypothetical protein